MFKKIQFKFRKVNENDKNLSTYSWDVGIMKRGYYVTGSYMCKVIEDELGCDKLAETIEYGPRFFIKTYYSLVGKDKKIIEFKD